MRIGINCGHTLSGPGSGAVGYLNESKENRAVGMALMEQLQALGHTVCDCTDDVAISMGDNLSKIVAMANAKKLDKFYSIHFNAGGGTGSEVYTMTGEETDETARILNALEDLGFRNRGTKKGAHLYVIRRTESPATLIEVCFVDTESDAKLYQKLGAKAVAAAICKGIVGEAPEQEEELSVKQYKELKQEIATLTKAVEGLVEKVSKLNSPMIYNYVDENMPEWAKPSVQKAMDKGILIGEGDGLNLTYSDLRAIVREDRAGLYD